VAAGDGSLSAPWQNLDEVNLVVFHSGDRVLLKRGSVCKGSLHLRGSGSAENPISISAYGTGALPRIEARKGDEAAFRLFNQEYWDISSLDLHGGTSYGVFISGDAGTMHHFHLRDLTVADVYGKLKRKESGLVVFSPTKGDATFDDVDLDGILASDTSQWAGIFINGASRDKPASHVRVRNSMVHNVQGDGIVFFNTSDGRVMRSGAWHTGMQFVESIGTPNGIWTWHCTDCIVEDDEAFLTDSPSVDGGAFDIDYGNTRNTVRDSYGHDTQGYCVGVFAAQGPTITSVIDHNLCTNNGISPRLAKRQGAILFTTWSGGIISGVEVLRNQIDWQPPEDTPVIQTDSSLHASGVLLKDNEIRSSASSFVASELTYRGEDNRYVLENNTAATFTKVQHQLAGSPEVHLTLRNASAAPPDQTVVRAAVVPARAWTLTAHVPRRMLSSVGSPQLRGILVALKSAAVQFDPDVMKVYLDMDGDPTKVASDWELHEDGVQLKQNPLSKSSDLLIELMSPTGKIVQKWNGYVGPVALGLALQYAGLPHSYGRLSIAKLQ
jgi:hypothetical protein